MSSDFEDRIEQLKGKISQLKNSLQTEEATENALVMPDFTADQGIKKGEKLLPNHAGQPNLCFSEKSCRSSIFTDDFQNQFHSDLGASNLVAG